MWAAGTRFIDLTSSGAPLKTLRLLVFTAALLLAFLLSPAVGMAHAPDLTSGFVGVASDGTFVRWASWGPVGADWSSDQVTIEDAQGRVLGSYDRRSDQKANAWQASGLALTLGIPKTLSMKKLLRRIKKRLQLRRLRLLRGAGRLRAGIDKGTCAWIDIAVGYKTVPVHVLSKHNIPFCHPRRIEVYAVNRTFQKDYAAGKSGALFMKTIWGGGDRGDWPKMVTRTTLLSYDQIRSASYLHGPVGSVINLKRARLAVTSAPGYGRARRALFGVVSGLGLRWPEARKLLEIPAPPKVACIWDYGEFSSYAREELAAIPWSDKAYMAWALGHASKLGRACGRDQKHVRDLEEVLRETLGQNPG